MDVGDICKRTHRYVDKTTRIAQVLDPSYDLYGQIIQDDPKYTKPKLLKKYIPEGHLLQTRDIPGAFTGWTKAGRERREFKNTNMTSDIEGAQSGSIKHSIVTTRSTHPLVPQYQSLDGDVLQSPVVSLLPAALIKQATLRPPPSKQIRASPTKPISDILTVEMRRGVTNDWTDSDSNNLFFSQPTARSPRSVAPLTTMDSAAYGSDRNKSNDFGASTIFLRANATPRSGRLSVKDTNIESKASPRCERTNATSRPMVAYADKFIKTESILVPAVVDDRPPLPRGKVGVPPGRGVPKDRSLIPPPLDLSLAKPSSSSNSSRSMGQASGRNSGGGSGASSARVCLVSPAKRQEAQELAESIKTIRSLQ